MSTVGALAQMRRLRMRSSCLATLDAASRPITFVRFLLAHSSDAVANESSAVAEEQQRHRDLLFLPMNESRFLCAKKYLLWFEHCATHFGAARFWAIADVDVHLNLARLSADLSSVAALGKVRVLWGLIMWHCYYDEQEMVTHNCWGSWQAQDDLAVLGRRAIERCRDAHRSNGSDADAHCRLCLGRNRSQKISRDGCLQKSDLHAIRSGGLSSFPPFAFPNGPLFAVSADLGRLLLRDTIPRTYLQQLVAVPRVAGALAAPPAPAQQRRPAAAGCYPAADSIIGFWISAVSLSRKLSVTLVNTPFMKQHHPWAAGPTSPMRFTNASIVLHGLKSTRSEVFRTQAIAQGSGPFVHLHRRCRRCTQRVWARRPRWCTWAEGPCVLYNWTCCE